METCEINDASLFLQVIREKRDPRSILREAVSNAWDAGARRVHLDINPLSRDTLDLIIEDNGHGIERNRFSQFFGLAMSEKIPEKTGGAFIGHKGLGTKLYFNSRRVRVQTITKDGHSYEATLNAPVDALKEGRLPSFEVRRAKHVLRFKYGTRIEISGIPVNTQSPLLSVDGIVNYLRWYSAAGSAREIFEPKLKGSTKSPRFEVRVTRRHINRPDSTDVVNGHLLPEAPPRRKGAGPLDPNDFVYVFDPFKFTVKDEAGRPLAEAQVAGAVVGANAHVVKDRRIKKRFKGVFLCKDHFAIRSVNEEVTGNSGEWQSFHVLVNCQDLQLTMSREDFVDTGDGSVYDALVRAVRQLINDALRGRRFEYLGETIEKGPRFAGQGYRELQECKAAWDHSEANNRITFTVLDLSTRRELPETLAGGPYFEPQEKIGTLLVFQSLLANSALDSAVSRVAEDYRLLSFSPEQHGLVLLQTRENGGWSEPRFYGVQHSINVKHLREAKQRNLAGIVTWSLSRTLKLDVGATQAPRLNLDGLDVLVVSNLLGIQGVATGEEEDNELTKPEDTPPVLLEE